MENELQEIQHNQLMILERLKALEEAQHLHQHPIQHQQTYVYPQPNLRSPGDFLATILRDLHIPTALLVMVQYLMTLLQEMCFTLMHQVLCCKVTTPHLVGM